MAPPQRIKQWLTDQNGLDKLRLEETDCPTPGQDEVLVKVQAVSLNYRDTEGELGQHTRLGARSLTGSSRHGPLQPS